MRFFEPKDKKIIKDVWFAWYPVWTWGSENPRSCLDLRLVWMEKVNRRVTRYTSFRECKYWLLK